MISCSSPVCHDVYISTAWGPPELYIATAVPVIAADGSGAPLGVAYAASRFDQFASFMTSLLDNPIQQRAFIVDEDGLIITATHGSVLKCVKTGPNDRDQHCERVRVNESDDPMIALSGAVLMESGGDITGQEVAADGAVVYDEERQMRLQMTTDMYVCAEQREKWRERESGTNARFFLSFFPLSLAD